MRKARTARCAFRVCFTFKDVSHQTSMQCTQPLQDRRSDVFCNYNNAMLGPGRCSKESLIFREACVPTHFGSVKVLRIAAVMAPPQPRHCSAAIPPSRCTAVRMTSLQPREGSASRCHAVRTHERTSENYYIQMSVGYHHVPGQKHGCKPHRTKGHSHTWRTK